MSIQILYPFLNWAVGFFGHMHTAIFIYLWLCWVFVAVHGLSLVVENGGYSLVGCAGFSLWCFFCVALCVQASVAVALGLSCSLARGIFPDQGLDLCPLNWQADSYPSCGILVL